MTSRSDVPNNVVAMPGTERATLVARAAELIALAETFEVVDQATYNLAGRHYSTCAALEKKIVGFFAPHKSNAHATWKGLCKDENDNLSPVRRAKAFFNEKAKKWKAAEEQRRQALAPAIEAAAEEKVVDAILAEAAALERAGQHEAAALVLAQPVLIPRPDLGAVKSDGANTSTRYIWEVTDLFALICYVAENGRERPELVALLAENPTGIRNYVNLTKKACRLPGITVTEESNFSAKPQCRP